MTLAAGHCAPLWGLTSLPESSLDSRASEGHRLGGLAMAEAPVGPGA